MNHTSGIVKRVRLGDDVLTHCNRCKEERTHQVVALKSEREIERVICRTCHSNHLYRDRAAEAKRTSKTSSSTRTTRAAQPRNSSADAERSYSIEQAFAAGEWILHPKFGTGRVIEARSGKIDVKFGNEVRTLLHAG